MVKITQMKKMALRQAAFRLAIVAFALLAPLGLRAQNQLNEGFEGTTFPPQDWTPIHVSGSSNWQRNTSYHNSDAACAYIAYASNGAENYLVTPKLAPQDGESFSFYIKQTNSSWSGTTITIEVSTTDATAASFTTVLATYTSGSSGNLSTSFAPKSIDLSAYVGQEIFIAFHVVDDDGNNICIDDVTGVSLYVPSCPKPTDLAAALTPGDGSIATLSWTKGGEETNWVVEYSTSSDFSGATQVTSGFITTDAPSISVNLTSLTAETKYYARVKADCGGGDESEWSNTISFTPTNAYTLSLNESSGTNYYVPIYYSYISYSSLNTASQFIIPASDLNSIQWADIEKLTFYANTATANYGNAEFTVYAGETAATTQTSFTDWNTLTEVYTGSVSVNNNMMEITFDNPFSYTTGNLLIGIKITTAGTNPSSFTWKGVSGLTTGVSLYSGYYSTPSTQSFLPQVTISYTPGEAPSCLPVSELATTLTPGDGTVATLTWTENGSASDWVLQYGTNQEFTVGSYTEVTTGFSVDGTTVTANLTSLTAEQTYYARVKADCGENGESDWSFVTNFTPTNAIIVNSGTEGTNGTVPLATNYKCSYDQMIYTAEQLAAAGITGPCSITKIGFKAAAANTVKRLPTLYMGNTDKSAFSDNTDFISINNLTEVYVREYSDNTTDPDLWTITAGWNEFELDEPFEYDGTSNLIIAMHCGQANYYNSTYFNHVATTGNQVVYAYNDNADPIPATYEGTWSTYSGTKSTSTYLPVLRVYATPLVCPRPLGLEATDITTGEATLSWTETGSATAWQICLNGDEEHPIDVRDNPYPLTDLTPGTNYAVKVRSNCEENGYSEWSSVLNFITEATCTEPSDLQVVDNSVESDQAQVSWTVEGEEASWDIYYSTSSTAPTSSTTPTVIATNDNPYTLTDLTPNQTTYYVWVRAHCGDGDGEQSPWIGGISFNTECEAVTTFPWRENFESRASGNFSDPCWVNDHLVSVSNRTDVFKVNTSTNGTNSTHQLQLPDMQAGNTVKLRLPEMTLPNNNYQFTIDFYRNDGFYGSYTTEGVSVFASTDGEIVGATLLAFIPRPHSTSNSTGATTIPEETAAGWYTYEFPIPFSGTCYIILRGESQYGSATYMDNLVVERVPLCRKPSALMLNTPSARTAHTATLKWTNGAEGQNAWQIAYKAGSNFDPNDAEALATATIVNVTTNPATIEGLAQSTTYYAYVRANCGTDGYSDWSVDNATFTTLAGNVTPTGLAVAANTITSDQATASWNAVAGNTLHQSYDIYWVESPDAAPVTAVPENPTAPNLISGITATSQVISDLTPETKYRVWVRDNCGTDGLSAWSSYVTFTTASACQTPDGLAKNNVTNNSATISWNAYGQTGFNLRYSTDGENWTTENNVNTPYILNNVLIGNTTYQVQVQATCNTEAWSTVLNFTTKCDARNDFPISYGFETTEGYTAASNATTNTLGNCWRNEATSSTSSTYTTRLWSASSSYHHVGDQSLVLPDKGSFSTTLLAFPAMNFTSDNGYKVSFWINRNGSSSSTANPEGFKVYASNTDTIDANAVLLGHYSRNYGIAYPKIESSSGWYKYDIYIPQSTITGTVYLIFEGQSYYGNATYVDDVTIEEGPSCYPVGTLAAATNVAARSAQLSWTLVDNTQDAWQVAYKADADADFTIVTNVATTNTNYTLNGLTPETHYTVKVRANCGSEDGTSEWSNTISFTTEPTCYPVGTLAAATNVTPFAASLSWTLVDDNQTQWDVQYATDNAFSENVGIRENVNVHTNYELNHLTPETEYYVRVRANCGNEDGQSVWSNVINFTTDIACQKPTNLALVEEEGNPTQTTAKLSWTENGLASAWTIAYKAEGADEFIERMIINDPTTTLNNLTQGTNYTVKVRAICGGDYGNSQWSDEFNFQTVASCPAPENLAVTDNSETAHGATITWDGEADSYNIEYAEGPLAGLATLLDEGFEGGSMPTGWTSTSTWAVGSGSGNSSGVSTAATGSKNVNFYTSNSYTTGYLITPAMNMNGITTATLTFNYVNPDWYGGYFSLTVYYRVNDGEWTELESYTTSQASWIQKTIPLTGMANNYQIGFKAVGYNNDYGYGVGLDDIKITAEYTPTYSWNTLVSDITEEEYVITELDPQTDYVVRVRGNCSGTLSPESNSEIVGFTTGIACQAPTALGIANLTHNSVDLTWTENGSATKWQICVNGDEENLIDLIASDVTIDGNTITRHMLNLLWETPYTMKVRANCEGEGYSDWSNTVNFTTLVGCGQPTNFTLGTVEAHQASFSWTGGVYNESWNVYVKKHSDASYPTTPNTAMTFTPSTTINGLDAETAYDVKIVPNCDENKFLEVANAFTTAVACPAPTNLAVTDGSITANGATITWDGSSSDGYVVSVGTYDYTATPITGTILEEDFESGMPEGWTHLGEGSISVQTPSAQHVHGGTHVLRFNGTTSYNLAVMPELPVETNQLTLDFWSKAEGSSSGTFEYGYVTDATDASSFNALGSFTASSTNTHQHVENLSMSTAPDGARIAFRHQSGNSSWYWFIDDITISGPTYPISWTEDNTTDQSYTFDNLDPETFYMVKVKGDCGEEGYSNETEAISFTTAAACQVPDGLAPSNVTNNSATISWNAYGQTGFNLRYSTDGENWTTENDVTNPYLFNEVLIGNTEYQVQVQVTCNTEEWSNVLNFTTKCDALSGNDFPWREDFESYSTGNFSDNCWVNEHLVSVSNRTDVFKVNTSTNGTNSTHQLQLPDMQAGNTVKLVLPGMNLSNNNFWFTLDVYRSNDTYNSSYAEEGIRVYISTNKEIEGATELAFIPRQYNVNSSVIPEESSTGWYTYQLPLGDVTLGTTYYIILRGESKYCTATYMDNFKVAEYSVEKTYQPNKWYAIASPVHDIYGTAQSVDDGTTVNLATDPYDLYSYNEVEGSWMNYKNNPFALEMGMGYIYRHGDDNNRTVSYVGAPNSGDINVTITSDCSDDDLKGFNLLGNPYPHEYTLSSAHYTLSTNGCWMSHPSGTIAVAEGFLVSAEEDHFDFTESSSKGNTSSTPAIAFTVSNGEYEDVAYALLENGHGLPKIGHLNSEAPMLSIPVDNRRYAVAMLGEECQGFDMIFRATTGQYTLTVDNGIEGLSYLHLLDRATGRDIDLLREHTYTFNVTASNADRFSVKLSPEAVESTSAHFAYWNGNNWVVEGTGMLQVYDVTGRCLSTLEVDGKLTTDNGNLGISHTGVYVFRMGEKSQKIVVK